MKKINAIPVVMFHSVRPREYPWHWNHLSYPPRLFDAFLSYLKKNGYTTIRLHDVLDYISGTNKIPERSIALTFDDGYLDNWTIVAPLLKHYGYCGTVFVNPEFVDKRDVVRRQVVNWEERQISEDLFNGYMSWQELRMVNSAGILDVQSHGMTHTWYYSSDKIIDFHHPRDRYPWLAWNARPERKYLWLEEDQSDFVDYGVPVYTHEKSFIVRRHFSPVEVDKKLSFFVKKHGGMDFFSNSDWRDVLMNQATSLQGIWKVESDDDYEKRILWELQASREEINSRLGGNIDIICWPGGGYNCATTELASICGYKAWTVNGLNNRPGGVPQTIQRISLPCFFSGIWGHLLNRIVFIYKVESSRGEGMWAHARLILPKLYPLLNRYYTNT